MAKKEYPTVNIPAAPESAVKAMTTALKATNGLNAMAMKGMRFLQVRIHSKVESQCDKINAENQKNNLPTETVFTWKSMLEVIPEISSLINILRDSEIPLWSRRFIAKFTSSYIGIPIVIGAVKFKSKSVVTFDIEKDAKFPLKDIKSLKSHLESMWNTKYIDGSSNELGNRYPSVFPESDSRLKESKKKEPKKHLQLVEALAKKLRKEKEDRENQEIATVLEFIQDNFDLCLLLARKATEEEKELFNKTITDRMKTENGDPKAP